MMRRMLKSGSGAIVLALMAMSPAEAEITAQADNGFAVKHEVMVSEAPEAAYAMIRSPAKWWAADHTFTLNADNLYMDAQAGGCFCELIPFKGNEEQLALRGSVQHMRILYAEPGKMLRLSGALGPLQSEAVGGTMTIMLEPIKGGTIITFEYVVGGYMRFPVAAIAPAVDKVIGQQVSRLAMAIGPLLGAKRMESQPFDAIEGQGVDEDEGEISETEEKPLPDSENAAVEEEISTAISDDQSAEPEIRPGDDLLNIMAGIGADDDVTAPPE